MPRRVSGPDGRRRHSATSAPAAATWCSRRCAARPDYLFTWLAAAYTGAILVTANPRSAPAELAGLIGQVEPRLVASDPGLDEVMAAARAGAPARLWTSLVCTTRRRSRTAPARRAPTTRRC